MSIHPNSSCTNDEIDLRELAFVLWAKKGIVVAITLVITLAAAVYASLSTPVYQTQAGVLPAPASSLMAFNARASDLGVATGTWATSPNLVRANELILTTGDAHNLLLHFLSSSTLKRQFQNKIRPTLADPTELPTITVTPSGQTIMITLQSNNPALLAQWTNDYLDMAAQAAQHELNQGLRNALDTKLSTLEASLPSDGTAPSRLNQLRELVGKQMPITVYTVDQPAFEPQAPIKPKKALIIALGFILGAMLSVFLILIRHTFQKTPTAASPTSSAHIPVSNVSTGS